MSDDDDYVVRELARTGDHREALEVAAAACYHDSGAALPALYSRSADQLAAVWPTTNAIQACLAVARKAGVAEHVLRDMERAGKREAARLFLDSLPACDADASWQTALADEVLLARELDHVAPGCVDRESFRALADGGYEAGYGRSRVIIQLESHELVVLVTGPAEAADRRCARARDALAAACILNARA